MTDNTKSEFSQIIEGYEVDNQKDLLAENNTDKVSLSSFYKKIQVAAAKYIAENNNILFTKIR